MCLKIVRRRGAREDTALHLDHDKVVFVLGYHRLRAIGPGRYLPSIAKKRPDKRAGQVATAKGRRTATLPRLLSDRHSTAPCKPVQARQRSAAGPGKRGRTG